MAPTWSHPGVDSAAADTALGPVAALMDRTRDAARQDGLNRVATAVRKRRTANREGNT